MEKVDKNARNGCWEWTAQLDSDGYGRFRVGTKDGKDVRARSHRVSYTNFVKPFPVSRNVVVRHKCNNRKCVNPSHLSLGTHQDNANDRVKSRTTRSSRRYNRVQIGCIKALNHYAGLNPTQIARAMKMNDSGRAFISRLLREGSEESITWKGVNTPKADLDESDIKWLVDNADKVAGRNFGVSFSDFIKSRGTRRSPLQNLDSEMIAHLSRVQSKLTDEQAAIIKFDCLNLSMKDYARLFNVSYELVKKVRQGRRREKVTRDHIPTYLHSSVQNLQKGKPTSP